MIIFKRMTPFTLALFLTLAAAAAPASTVEFIGMCDASGAVPLAGGRFVVADDEDNVLRVYDADRGGAPLQAVDVSPALDLPRKKKTPEADLEAATRVGDRALWLTSHGRNSKGKPQPARLQFFATSLPEKGRPMTPVGKPYHGLLQDLLEAPALARFGLREAEGRSPKEPGGLNIEGMTARPDDKSVIIGFRNPVPREGALLVPILNPLEMMDGQRARLGTPTLLDLGGRGVRSISFWRGRYLIVGGGIASEAESALFTWDGTARVARPVPGLRLDGWNPEAFASFEDRDRILLLSDDGTRLLDGEPCKKLKDPGRKRFRGRWVEVPAASASAAQ
jgi:hypothetical protein